MSNIILGSEVSVLGGDSLDLVLQNIINDVNALMGPTRFSLYTNQAQLEALGLNYSNMTLLQLALATPLYSSIVIPVGASQAFASTLPLPYISQASAPEYMDGTLTVETLGGDYRRVNFTFRNRDHVATCSYLSYTGSNVSPWVFQNATMINRLSQNASSWGGVISNIWMPGTYYFNTAQAALFTDKPSGWPAGGIFIEVVNKDGTPTGDTKYTMTLNDPNNLTVAVKLKATAWKTYTLE